MAFLGITPYLYYEDGAAALDWLGRVFDSAAPSARRGPTARSTRPRSRSGRPGS